MSKIGIYLLYAALVGAILAAVAGGFLINKGYTQAAVLAQTQTDKAAAETAAAKAKQEALAAQQATADAQTKLTAANASVADLNNQLTSAKKDADDAKAAVTTATTNAQAAKDALDKMTAALGGKSPEEVMAAQAKAAQDLATAQSELKILQDQFQEATTHIDQLKKEINASKVGAIPPGVSGKVTFVNRTWNFVVLDVGLSNGVVPNGELIIYRGRDFLGKVKVTSAEENSCVADIQPDVKGDIQVGDFVLN